MKKKYYYLLFFASFVITTNLYAAERAYLPRPRSCINFSKAYDVEQGYSERSPLLARRRVTKLTREDVVAVVGGDEVEELPKVVYKRQSRLNRFGIPLVMAGTVITLGFFTYANLKTTSTLEKYAPQLEDGITYIQQIKEVADQFGSVLAKCPEGRDYLIEKGTEVLLTFLNICNCSGGATSKS